MDNLNDSFMKTHDLYSQYEFNNTLLSISKWEKLPLEFKNRAFIGLLFREATEENHLLNKKSLISKISSEISGFREYYQDFYNQAQDIRFHEYWESIKSMDISNGVKDIDFQIQLNKQEEYQLAHKEFLEKYAMIDSEEDLKTISLHIRKYDNRPKKPIPREAILISKYNSYLNEEGELTDVEKEEIKNMYLNGLEIDKSFISSCFNRSKFHRILNQEISLDTLFPF